MKKLIKYILLIKANSITHCSEKCCVHIEKTFDRKWIVTMHYLQGKQLQL